jgi:hypothetical protein
MNPAAGSACSASRISAAAPFFIMMKEALYLANQLPPYLRILKRKRIRKEKSLFSVW